MSAQGRAGLHRRSASHRSWEDNGITRYVTEILVKTTAPCRCWYVPQVLRLSRKRGKVQRSASAGTTGGGRYEKRWPKTKGRGRKAAQPEPQPQPPRVTITGFQTISRSERLTVTTPRPVRGITGEMRMSEYFRILRDCLTVLLPANMPKPLPHSPERLYRG